MSSHHAGIALALASAVVWGSGDFSGGYAARRHHALQVLALAAISGTLFLLAAVPLFREPIPSVHDGFWAVAAGLAGAIGIAGLYQALSFGAAAEVAPIAAVVGAALPTIYGGATQGVLDLIPLSGLLLAMIGIWLVVGSTKSGGPARLSQVGLAVMAGIGFGGFFILLAQLNGVTVFGPLFLARVTMLAVSVVGLRAGKFGLPSMASNPPALLAGLLDASGNVLYFMAQLRTRLDIAAVLSSLYPVTTVLLALFIFGEPVTRRQWLGVVVCMIAITLIVSG